MRAERSLPLISAVAAGIAVLAVTLVATGHDPIVALGAMWRGAFGSWDTILSAVLPRSIPLIVIGLGIGLAFRAGALNIGAEGQFYAGAIAATWAGLHLNGWPGSSGYRCPADHFDPGRRLMGRRARAAPRPLRRAGGDQHPAAEFRGRRAGKLDGAGAATGNQADLSAERSDRSERPLAADSGNPAALGAAACDQPGSGALARSIAAPYGASSSGPRARDLSLPVSPAGSTPRR